MALRDWLRPPRQVLGIFLAVAVLSTAALGWLTWRLLDQDAQLEAQRERVRLEQAADATVAGTQRSLAGTDGAAGLSRHGQLHGLPYRPDVLGRALPQHTGVAFRNGQVADDGRFLVTRRAVDRGHLRRPRCAK